MKSVVASFLGGLFGVGLFLIAATYFFGDPFGDWFTSAHAILSAEKQAELTEADNINLYNLLSRGLVISSDGIIENITSLYGNMIQTLIGMLGVATVFAFLAVRWTSVQATQEFVEQKANSYFGSGEFKALVATKTSDALDLMEPDMMDSDPAQNQIKAMSLTIEELTDRIEKLEGFIRSTASAEEPSDEPKPQPRRSTRRK